LRDPGDYAQTARAIAARASLEAGDVVTGSDIEQISDDEIAQRVRSATVFARTMPEQEPRILNARKANGEVVANDRRWCERRSLAEGGSTRSANP
jgi:P-type Ca2+ transporter type 2C